MRRDTATGRLSRDVVAAAALDLVAGSGVEALTMRRLAEVLGVTPMALYNHVASRAELLDAVADRVAREMAVDEDPGAPWDVRVRHAARAIRATYLRHPEAAVLVQTAATPSPALLAPAAAVVAALEDAGFSPADARRGWAAVIGFVNGHVGYQLNGHLSDDEAELDTAFEFALDALVHGLDALRVPGSD